MTTMPFTAKPAAPSSSRSMKKSESCLHHHHFTNLRHSFFHILFFQQCFHHSCQLVLLSLHFRPYSPFLNISILMLPRKIFDKFLHRRWWSSLNFVLG